MDDIDFACEFRELTGDEIIVQRHCPVVADELIWDTELAAGEGGVNGNFGRDGSQEAAGEYGYLGSGRGQTFDLLPGCITDPLGPQLIREAVENANRLVLLRQREAAFLSFNVRLNG